MENIHDHVEYGHEFARAMASYPMTLTEFIARAREQPVFYGLHPEVGYHKMADFERAYLARCVAYATEFIKALEANSSPGRIPNYITKRTERAFGGAKL